MTPRKWLDGHPWDGNGSAFGELACWRISLLLWTLLMLVTACAVCLLGRGGVRSLRSWRRRPWRCRVSAPRPVQLGMLEGADKAVGPLLPSVVHGTNADLIAAIAPLYLTGSVLDVTYGRGMWWRRYRPETLVAHDLELDGVDFRALPHPDSSFDTVCFDPPYVPRHGSNHEIPQRDVDFRDRFGLTEPRTELQMRQLINDGLTECARVARQWVLVKCNDYCNGRQFHLGHIRVLEHASQLGLRCHDLLIHATGTGPGGGQIRVPKRARRAHSYLLVLNARQTGPTTTEEATF